MSIIENLKRHFGFSAKTDPSPSDGEDTHAPGGLNTRPDGGKGVTTLNKKPILIGVAAVALVAAGAWAGMDMLEHQKIKIGGADNVTPGHAVDVAIPPAPQKKKTWLNTSKPPSAAKPAQKKPSTSHHHAEQARQTAQNRTSVQDKAEQTAFQQQMLVSNGGGAWQSHGENKSGAGNSASRGVKNDGETGAAVYDTHIEHRPVSPYELMAGAVIPAVLTTSIQSDLPGQITAQVSRNIYDSQSGAYLLIPAGARLVGFYSDKVIAGQTRVGVDWTRIMMPNGAYINLGKMPGAGPSGKDGLHDLVNDHTWEIFKNALLMSIVDLGISVSQPGYGSAGGYGQTAVSPAQEGEASLMQTFGQAESNILQRYTNIAPTLTIRAGYQLNVAVTKDVVFPGPYSAAAGPAYRGPAAPSAIAPATAFNLYPPKG